MSAYSTNQAAKKLGITGAALSRYIKAGKVPAPEVVHTGWKDVHIWTDEDIERIRDLLPEIANGRKTRYAKKQLAAGNWQLAKSKPKAKTKTKKRQKPQPRAAVPHGHGREERLAHKKHSAVSNRQSVKPRSKAKNK
jgi:predicted transcriptional regulator